MSDCLDWQQLQPQTSAGIQLRRGILEDLDIKLEVKQRLYES